MNGKMFTEVEIGSTHDGEPLVCMYNDGHYIRYTEERLENLLNSLAIKMEYHKNECNKNNRYGFRELSNGTIRIIDTWLDDYYFITGKKMGSAWEFCTLFMHLFQENERLSRENKKLRQQAKMPNNADGSECIDKYVE